MTDYEEFVKQCDVRDTAKLSEGCGWGSHRWERLDKATLKARCLNDGCPRQKPLMNMSDELLRMTGTLVVQ